MTDPDRSEGDGEGRAGPSVGFTRQPYVTESDAVRMLDEFLPQDPYAPDVIPKRLDPSLLERYLRDRFDERRDAPEYGAARRLVGFYQLRGVLDLFAPLLREEVEDHDDVSRVAAVIAMFAEVGDASHREEAADAYRERLLTSPTVDEQLPLMVSVWARLDPDVSSEPLRGVIDDVLSGYDDESAVGYQRTRSLRENDLWQAERAMEARRELEGRPADRRVAAATLQYARLDELPPRYLHDWAAYTLLRTARREEGRRSVVRRLRDTLTGSDFAEADADLKALARLRLLRAVELFDPARLSEAERSELEEALGGGQDDLLSIVQPDPELTYPEGSGAGGGPPDGR